MHFIENNGLHYLSSVVECLHKIKNDGENLNENFK